MCSYFTLPVHPFVFSNTYAKVQTNAKQIWMFQRYHLVKEYKHKPFLVPPLIIFKHVFSAVRFLCKRCHLEKNEKQGDDTNMPSAIYSLWNQSNARQYFFSLDYSRQKEGEHGK